MYYAKDLGRDELCKRRFNEFSEAKNLQITGRCTTQVLLVSGESKLPANPNWLNSRAFHANISVMHYISLVSVVKLFIASVTELP
jgi:hypothetical protein